MGWGDVVTGLLGTAANVVAPGTGSLVTAGLDGVGVNSYVDSHTSSGVGTASNTIVRTPVYYAPSNPGAASTGVNDRPGANTTGATTSVNPVVSGNTTSFVSGGTKAPLAVGSPTAAVQISLFQDVWNMASDQVKKMFTWGTTQSYVGLFAALGVGIYWGYREMNGGSPHAYKPA